MHISSAWFMSKYDYVSKLDGSMQYTQAPHTHEPEWKKEKEKENKCEEKKKTHKIKEIFWFCHSFFSASFSSLSRITLTLSVHKRAEQCTLASAFVPQIEVYLWKPLKRVCKHTLCAKFMKKSFAHRRNLLI